MEHRGHKTTPDQVLERLCQCQQFRYAMRNGWEYDGQDATSTRNRPPIAHDDGHIYIPASGTIAREPLTKDRRKKTSELATAV